jgi:hypothetical protein
MIWTTSKQQPQKGSKAGRKQQGGSSSRAAAAAVNDLKQELFCSAFGYGMWDWLCCPWRLRRMMTVIWVPACALLAMCCSWRLLVSAPEEPCLSALCWLYHCTAGLLYHDHFRCVLWLLQAT